MPEILIVEDEEASRKLMESMFSKYGSCTTVESGEAGLESFKEKWAGTSGYDLILLDLSLGGMSGLDVLTEIRTMEKDVGIPKKERVKIVIVSSNSEKKKVRACIKAGCSHYILKPVEKENVKEKMEICGFKEIG